MGLVPQLVKRNTVTLIWTYPNISGTFKSYPSHSNKQFFRCNWPSLTKCIVFMHSNNHKFHYGNFACLWLDLRLQIKKLRFKRWFCTVFQESTCYCVTWKIKEFFVQNWFLTMLYSFFCNLYLVWGTHKKYHDNIRSLLQGKQPQYRLKFNKMLLCDICWLV